MIAIINPNIIPRKKDMLISYNVANTWLNKLLVLINPIIVLYILDGLEKMKLLIIFLLAKTSQMIKKLMNKNN